MQDNQDKMEYKEFKKLHKEKKIHTKEEVIKKEGVHFSIDDLSEFFEEAEKELKNKVKKEINELLKDLF